MGHKSVLIRRNLKGLRVRQACSVLEILLEELKQASDPQMMVEELGHQEDLPLEAKK
jgi:hypothetical protein